MMPVRSGGMDDNMNIYLKELRSGFKPFIFWTLGLFVLAFAGLIKYTGFSDGQIDINELFVSFPRVVLAVMGLVGVDFGTLSGYFAVLMYYAYLCAAIYAVYLGSNAVSREAIDKTYEFLFTKPRSRSRILLMKLLAALTYLVSFCLLNYVFSVSAEHSLGLAEDIGVEMQLFSFVMFLIGFFFLCASAFISAVVKRSDKGSLYGNLFLLLTFLVGIIYDMLENAGIVKILSPFKYFNPADLIDQKLDPVYTAICLGLTALLLAGAFYKFKAKDYTEI